MRFTQPRFFWRQFAAYVALLLVSATIIALAVNRRMEAAWTSSLEKTLRAGCGLLSPYAEEVLARGAAGEIQARVEQLGLDSRLRTTLISTEGRVVGDSHEDPKDMEGHGSRPEFLQAIAEGVGVSERFSHTLGYAMLYVAKPVRRGGETLGVIRLAMPLEEVDAQLAANRMSIVLATSIGLGVALLLGLFVAWTLARPLEDLTRVANAMGEGDYEQRVEFDRNDEFGHLGESLNRIGAEVARRIAAVSRDDAQLRAMLAVMVEGVLAIDESDHILFINDAAKTMFDVELEECHGRSLWELAPISELQGLTKRTRSSSALARAEFDMFRTGKEQVIDAHAAPLQAGDESGLVIVLHDITDLRRLERVRRDFVANVSHELKTPLASIKGFVETLLDGALHDPEHNERFLARIDANVERLNELVSDLLSLARIESQEKSIKRELVDWRPIIEEVRLSKEDLMRRKGLSWGSRGFDERARVMGNAKAMRQVVDNLVDNAIKYTSAGEITVRFEIQGNEGVLLVCDTGLGIPAEDLDRIFERFYRVDRARSREVGGTGLGLSIVKHLVLSLGGRVSVESRVGQGTCFRVSLPMGLPS